MSPVSEDGEKSLETLCNEFFEDDCGEQPNSRLMALIFDKQGLFYRLSKRNLDEEEFTIAVLDALVVKMKEKREDLQAGRFKIKRSGYQVVCGMRKYLVMETNRESRKTKGRAGPFPAGESGEDVFEPVEGSQHLLGQGPSAGVPERTISEEMGRILAACLKLLSGTDQKLVYLRFWEDRSYQDIANTFGLKKDTVGRTIKKLTAIVGHCFQQSKRSHQ